MKRIPDGGKIQALYLGNIPVAGTVESSRVKYGGRLQYTVVLDRPITMRWRSEPVGHLLIDEDQVINHQGV